MAGFCVTVGKRWHYIPKGKGLLANMKKEKIKSLLEEQSHIKSLKKPL